MVRRIVVGLGGALALAVAAAALSGCHAGQLELSGRLTFAGAHPAANVTVSAFAADSETLVASTVTDADGRYALGSGGLPDGTYKIEFGQPAAGGWWNDASTFAAATPVTVSTSAPATVSTQLESGTFSGTITDGSGPVPDAVVRIENGDGSAEGSVVATVSTDAGGAYMTDALAPGQYRVKVSAPGFATRFISGSVDGAIHVADAAVITVVGGSAHTGQDLRMTGESTITGTVTDGTAPVGSISVVAYDATDGHLEALASSAPDGTFSVHGVNPTATTIGLFDATDEHAISVVGETDGAYDPGSGNGTTFTPPPGGTTDAGTVIIPGRDCTPDRNGASVNLSAADLAGADLRGCDLTRANLSNGNLKGADLAGANLTGNMLLKGVDLTDTNLTSASLTGTNLNNIDLSGASLWNVTSGGIVGNPFALPEHWICAYGNLIGPGANLTDAIIGTPLEGPYNIDGADFTDANLTRANFAHITLTGISLTGATISNAKFASATLTGTISGGLVGTTSSLPASWQVTDGYFVGPGANLTNADLTGADLASVDLTYADLTGATLTNATLSGTKFFGTKLRGLRSGGVIGSATFLPNYWFEKGGYLIGPGANLAGGSLAGADLSHTHLAGINLTGTNLTNVGFTNTDLSDATLTGATLTGADLTGATLISVASGGVVGLPAALPADWRTFDGYLIGPGAELGAATLSHADLRGFSLVGVNLTGADLTGATLAKVPFTYATLTGADLTNANFTDADLSSTTLTDATFVGADLTNADFSHADLTGANLTNAGVDGTDFTNATLTGMRTLGTVGTPVALPIYWVVSKGGFLIGPGANFSGDDLTGEDLTGTTLAYGNFDGTVFTDVDLTGVNLRNAVLTDAVLINTNLTNACLTDADLTGVVSSGIVGVPACLPAGWSLVGGSLVPN